MRDSALVQFKLMLPADLKSRIESHAQGHRRSLSQEIVLALEEKFPPPTYDLGDVLAMVDRINLETNPAERSALVIWANGIIAQEPSLAGLKIVWGTDEDGNPMAGIARQKR